MPVDAACEAMKPLLGLHFLSAHPQADALLTPGKGEHGLLGIPKEEPKQTAKQFHSRKKQTQQREVECVPFSE